MKDCPFSKEVIEQTLLWIDENVDKKITMDDLSSLSGYSKWYFQRLFTKYVKVTPATYIRRKKLLLSLTAIKYGTKNIGMIAEDYGFNSHQTYNRIFKKELGCTPAYCREVFKEYGCFTDCKGICKKNSSR